MRALLGVLAGVSVLVSSGLPADASAAKTRVVTVSPVTASGVLASGYTVTSTAQGGSCLAGSEAVSVAYRCFSGNFVYDPCWYEASPGHDQVLCLSNPLSRKAVRITGVTGLTSLRAANKQVWGVTLTNGKHCTLVQGATDVHLGRRLDYLCGTSTKSPYFVLLAGLDKHVQPWKVLGTSVTFSDKGSHYSPTKTYRVAVAYVGANSASP